MTLFDASFFLRTGLHEVRRDSFGSNLTAIRRFCAFFGCKPHVCARIWATFPHPTPPNFKPAHLMWGLLFLKKYDTESGNSARVGVDEKTFRKWQWFTVKKIALLQLVSTCFLLILQVLTF